MRRVIIDTDPGVDDAFALLMIMGEPDVRIEAITTVAGNVPVELATRNAVAINAWAKRSVPVVAGAAKPLVRTLEPATIHGTDGLSGWAPEGTPEDVSDDAAEEILELVKKYPGEIEILAIGPLTNIARAITLNPGSMRRIKSLTIMGGAWRVRGNTNSVAEFNFYTDPEAAAIILESGLPIVVVPLDCCYETTIDTARFSVLAKPLREWCDALTSPYAVLQTQNERTGGMVLYDTLAAYAFLEPNGFRNQLQSATVEAKIDARRGAVVQRNVPTDQFMLMTGVDSERVIQRVIENLGRLGEFEWSYSSK